MTDRLREEILTNSPQSIDVLGMTFPSIKPEKKNPQLNRDILMLKEGRIRQRRERERDRDRDRERGRVREREMVVGCIGV